jgi:dephospho-CoA kinase
MVLGITGGMGCGKSTVAREFEQRGFCRLDADATVRDRILPSAELKAKMRERYGDGLFGLDGEVDKKALAGRIFSDDVERKWLENAIHPGVFALWRRALAEAPMANWAVETPLLFEGGLEIWFDFTVCVACAHEQQLVRLEQRGLDRALAEQRISKQLPLTRKIDRADFVLWNEGSLEFLQNQIDRLITQLSPNESFSQRRR